MRNLTLAVVAALLLASTMAATELPDAPSRARVIDRSFLLWHAGAALAIGFDHGTTGAGMNRGCVESSPIAGRHPSAGRLALMGGVEWTVLTLTDALIKRAIHRQGVTTSDRHAWKILPALDIGAHTFAGSWNLSVMGGCRR